MGKKWLPLESNPDVMTEFASKIGLNVAECGFYDIWGLDDVRSLCKTRIFPTLGAKRAAIPQEALMVIPQPVLSVLFLFPITKESEESNKKGVRAEGQMCSAVLGAAALVN
jgi:ubiquitin carboxyl-terminal hydrolase L3